MRAASAKFRKEYRPDGERTKIDGGEDRAGCNTVLLTGEEKLSNSQYAIMLVKTLFLGMAMFFYV